MDYKEFIENVDISKEKADEMLEVIAKKYPNTTENQRYAIILVSQKKGDTYVSEDTEMFTGMCVGFSNSFDANRYLVERCMEMYKHDPALAEREGMVKIDTTNNEVIPLDYREYIDKNETMKNWNKGKPIAPNMRRNAYFIIDGELVTIIGNIAPEIGGVYNIYGKPYGDRLYTRGKGIVPVDILSSSAVWDELTSYLETTGSDYLVDSSDVEDVEQYELVFIQGHIKTISDWSRDNFFVVVTSDGLNGVIGFDSNGSVTEDMIDAEVGNEIIVFGKVRDSREKKVLNIYGTFINPNSNYFGDIVKEVNLMMDE